MTADLTAAAGPRLGASDCERLRDGLVAQPVNTASSLAYVVAGARVLRRAPQAEAEQRPPAVAVGVALVLLGLGSVAYHGPGRGRRLHDLSLVVVLALVAAAEVAAANGDHRPALPAGLTRGSQRGRGHRLAASAAAAGALLYGLGRTGGPLCRPDSLLQAHALWHLLTAGALGAWASAAFRRATPHDPAGAC